MRNTKVPLVCLAWAQLKRAVRIKPTWGVPVGEGQNRTRTGVSAVTSRVASRVSSVVAVLETASGAVGVVIVIPTLPRARFRTRLGDSAAKTDSRTVGPR